MTTHQITGRVFGREAKFEYSATWVTYALIIIRIGVGWILFQGGIVKVLDPEWTAAGFLQFAIPEGNPFMSLWANFAGNPTIDFLVSWGLTLTGLGLILGVLVRWNAFWAAIMMIFFWAASLHGGIMQGLPLEHGWVFDDHLVYAFLLFGLGAFGSGRVFGLDARIEQSEFVQRNAWLKYLLG